MSLTASRMRKVAVIMGGPSAEHDISLKSGRGVAEALARRGWEVEPLVVPRTETVEAAEAFAHAALVRYRPDVAFLAMHGTFGEDGTIQQVCDALELPYTGSGAQASRLGMDKTASRRRFETAGLSVPRWQFVDCSRGVPPPPRVTWAFPMVVKPSRQGSSVGVSIVQDAHQLAEGIRAAARFDGEVLVEEFVAGREVTVGILGGEPLPVVEICPSRPFFDYTAKYTSGMTTYRVPADLPLHTASRAQAAAASAHRTLGCRHLSRADLILRADGLPVVLEVNTIPGFTPTSLLPKAAAAVGISYEELCERLVVMALGEPRRKEPAAGRAEPAHA